MEKLTKSLRLNLTSFHGKKFKIISDTIRSGIKQEHGFMATKGITDKRLKTWPIIIRFTTGTNRRSFITSMKSILSSNTLREINAKKLKPTCKSPRTTRFETN
jgi:predicted regulator of amino acid metabolism with ACT domain